MPDVLQFARPESVGVNPDHVSNYVREMNRQRKMCHSFLMLRHGKVFAEGYWKPFQADRLHRQYSVSKSFVSLAIGLLVDDGKIRLTDKIVDYFPDMLPDPVHPLIAQMTIRDMLMMATCHKYPTYRFPDMNWLQTFFQPHDEPDHPAGSEFRYDTSASYTLDVLVQRITGQSFLEFLKDRVLRDIGFSGHAWCVKAPEGIDWGGSGVMCTTRDLARFGLLVLNHGYLNGKQYISQSYMDAATGNQIDNNRDSLTFLHGHGYGYQFWRMDHGCFGCLGMGGQLVVCDPERDFLFVCNSDTQGDEGDYVSLAQIMWDEVASKITDEELPFDDTAYGNMTHLLNNLNVNLPAGASTSPLAAQVNGVTYQLNENPMGITSFRLELNGDQSRVVFQTCRGEKVFHFGMGSYADDLFPETHYSGSAINHPLGRSYRCLHAGVWKSEQELLIRTYVIDDYFGNMHTVFTFDGDSVNLVMSKTAEAFLDEYCGKALGHRVQNLDKSV